MAPYQHRLLRDTRGLTTVEYVILATAVVIVAFAAWREFGDTVKRKLIGDRDHGVSYH